MDKGDKWCAPVLGPLLFLINININDIDDSVCNSLLKFADDTKIYSVVSDKLSRRPGPR